MTDAIRGFDDLPPAVRRKLRSAPANLIASEILAICRVKGEQAALAAIERYIEHNRPEFHEGTPEAEAGECDRPSV